MSGWWAVLHGLAGLEAAAGDGDGDALRLHLDGGDFELRGVVGDSVTLTDGNGATVYADLDGDGTVDHISSVHHDGGYDIFTADPHRAAWGLVADPARSQTADGKSGWGLPPNGTPEIGGDGQGSSQGIPGWHRLERG